ncbi:anaphase-promoting complex subunit cut9 [Cladorrhinum samala]|uniref:Anaphase-promoting complex subunit cut9 n=1 Tax=Cladorrhinum samala TaxID=585594 RepID=A0AAV9HSM6_9PEZI|nr:anaphase-promoting complex subunit cut9 [Cladorrhinum samala]
MTSLSQRNMEKFLRDWRQDALNKAQYESAIYVGDKLLAMTRNDNDAFWLAQVHFAAGNHTRAHGLLSKHNLITSNPSCRYLAAHCLIKQNLFNDALLLLGEQTPSHLFSGDARRKASRTTTRSGPGRAGPKASERRHQGETDEDEAANRRNEAGMCYLRGLCFAKQNAFDRAKEAYKDALRVDVQCYEAFSQLVRNNLMSPDEEDTFMSSLDFNSVRAPHAGDDPDMECEPGEYVHMLYQTQLSKYRNPGAFNAAIESLTTHYGLEDNADILLARADLLYTQCRFKDALRITESIIQDDKFNFSAYPIYLACLYELRKTNLLFLTAHGLADSHPDEPCTWLAVGIYYFAIGKVAEARRYFSKASMMDANFGPAWIGFAHTFAAEGEHDQAVTAYSTAARLFTGTHLPQVFLGMQNHAMNNMTAAEEFLKNAYELCKTDPLLLNEMGIVYYHQDRLKDAAGLFRQALKIAEDTGSDSHAWIGARTNLGHAYRRLRLLDEALEQFDIVLREGGKDAAVFCAKGLIYLDQGKADEAAQVLHEALAIHPQDPIATELLSKALDESAKVDIEMLSGAQAVNTLLDLEEESGEMQRFEAELEERKMAARARIERKARGRGTGTGTAPASADKGKGVAGVSGGGRRRGGRGGYAALRGSMMEMSDDEGQM